MALVKRAEVSRTDLEPECRCAKPVPELDCVRGPWVHLLDKVDVLVLVHAAAGCTAR